MKKFTILAVVLVLTAAMLIGCGCRNSKPMPSETQPSSSAATQPTTEATRPSTQATTRPTQSTDATIEDGNGPLPTNATTGADGSTEGARSRGVVTMPTEGQSGRMPMN